jgi:predicted esterase
MTAVRAIPGAERWRIIAPQALHRFYTRGDRAVVASWMTRQDRESAIADNVAYIDRVLDLGEMAPTTPVVMIGFSQGASMAYRAAILGRHSVAGIVALAGDIPPDVRESLRRPWPPVLVGCGDTDGWYRTRVDHDVEFLTTRGVSFELVRFAGGHGWNDAFRGRVGEWMAGIEGR